MMYTGLFSCLVALTVASAQDSQQMKFAAAATSKFVSLPVLPSCMTLSVQEGDPAKTAVVVLAKFRPGCSVPWHWHSANERLMIVSGSGKAEMKNEKAIAMKPGDFIYMPAKGVHQFTAVTNVELFLTSDGPFDIHYVDANGTEIPMDSAVKSKSPPAKPE
jgi:quercetin dioxygenase-like cupin family protein